MTFSGSDKATTATPTALLDRLAAVLPGTVDEAMRSHRPGKTGELRLTMPTGRSELEHDTGARYLLAQALGVPVPGMPAPFVTTRIPTKQTEVTL